MSELKSKFGKRLKELRKNRGITQEKMAEYIDISIRNLSKIETGITFHWILLKKLYPYFIVNHRIYFF